MSALVVGGGQALGGDGASPAQSAVEDPHSFGKPSEVRVTKIDLDLKVHFDRKELEGVASLTYERRDGSAPDAPLILDTRELHIESVTNAEGKPIRFEVAPADPILGSALRIEIPREGNTVRVHYRTGRHASALQWLDAPQTTDGRHPFLFTQSQAIHARSWIPCQDSPGVRVTYTATVHVPEGLTAVMSADTKGNEANTYRFEMSQAIPPYLIALAVGELEFRAVGNRTGVWAEPRVLAKAVHEFADVERMLEVAERRFGPYRWGRYDILVLPPSFPFGGMENAKLTFATPTVLAGDRSLVSLIAHELAHSWSGNLVTCATWRDFWLNEGTTTYLERRIVEDLYGADRANIERVIGLRELRADLAKLKPHDQVLHIDLRGRDPDDAMNAIAYEKGALFLTHLEEQAGRDRFDAFLKHYFDANAFHSITTADFEAQVLSDLFADASGAVRARATQDLHNWLTEPGLPADAPRPASARLESLSVKASRWLRGDIEVVELGANDWSTQEWVYFLNGLPANLPAERLAELDAAYQLTTGANAEVLVPWLRHAIRAGYAPASERLESFLTSVGRRKYLMPLYEELVKSPAGRERAQAIFDRAKSHYHPIAAESVARVVGEHAGK